MPSSLQHLPARAALLGVALTLLLTLAGGGGAQAVQPGDIAPNCSLTPIAEGGLTTLTAAPGEVVLVDFWASWCPVCPHAFLFLNQLEREHRGRGLRIVGVSVDEDLALAREFLELHPPAFRVAADPSGTCPGAFGVEGMPASYLIDRSGRIRAATMGFKPGEAEALRGLVESLLDETSVTHSTSQTPAAP